MASLPTLEELTAQLRLLPRGDAPKQLALWFAPGLPAGYAGYCEPPTAGSRCFGAEPLPPAGEPWDSRAAARRLLAAARDGGAK